MARLVQTRDVSMEDLRDSPLERHLWHALRRSERLVGPLGARSLAVLVLTALSRSERGYIKIIYRVARHTSSAMPGIVRIPERWSAAPPLVRVKRLGVSLKLDFRDNLQRTLYYTGTYEPTLVGFIARELRCGDVFLDIGAHIGVHALAAARRLRQLGGGHVFAFEPTHDSATKLRTAAARNGLDLTVVESALGDADGTVDRYGDPAYRVDDAGVRSQYGSGPRVQQVTVMRFDAWANAMRLDRLDIVKVDVEGAEPMVIRGMQQSLKRLRPRLLIIEVKAVTLQRAGVDEATLRQFLQACGYAPTGQTLLFHNQVFRPR